MDVELHLEQLAIDLDVAAREARDRTQEGNRRGISTFAGEIHHRRWLQSFLKEMTSVIDTTARNTRAGSDGQLYVWPGYDSILLAERRVTFDVDRDVRRALSMHGYENGLSTEDSNRAMQTGVAFPTPDMRTDRATLYFDAALAATPATSADDENTFSVGSTHNWLALNPTVGTDPLVGLEVRTVGNLSIDHRSFPRIVLDPGRPLEWGDAVASAISATCGESPECFWPLPTRRTGESLVEYRRRLHVEYGSPRHRSIRQRLYSLWLVGCFVPAPAQVLLEGRGHRWLGRLIADLEIVEPERAKRVAGLRELERNLEAGAESMLDPAYFTTWGVVTIPYPIATDSKTAEGSEEYDDLGSGMLLTNLELPSWYYFMIRQWIASYYLSLRQQESSIVLAEREAQKAALDAERLLRRQLSHAIGTELTYVEFLATIAEETISEDKFTPNGDRVMAGVTRLRNIGDGDGTTEVAFREKHGQVTSVESDLIQVILNNSGENQLSRDITLIKASLAAIPANEGRNVLAALTAEVSRTILENRALVRVDDAAVFAQFEISDERTGGSNEVHLSDLLGRALVVAFTVFFRKAFPPHLEGPEEVCVLAAGALFGDAHADESSRRGVARECAIDWRNFLARCYRREGRGPNYAAVTSWLGTSLRGRARLRVDFPDPEDRARLAPGCGDHAPLVVQAWLTEALLNALKHSRSASLLSEVTIGVDWMRNDTLLEVRNTTSEERANAVATAVEAASRGESTSIDGHQGLAFLGYAARHLFRGHYLQSQLDHGSHTLHLRVQ